MNLNSMKIYSNNPFPEIPQKWNDTKYIYYYNRVDIGDQSDGNRYEADFVVVDAIDQETIDKAIELASVDPVKAREIVDNIKPGVWHAPLKPVQLKLTHAQNTMLMQSPYGVDLLTYFNSIKPETFNEEDAIYIYLKEIFPQHRDLLEGFGAVVIDKNNPK